MSLPKMISDLMKASAYPGPPGQLELVQTHISYLILSDLYVYKIKKPVNFGFLDFSTLDKRRFYCGQELELNRRLSPDIYLDLLEIKKRDGRHFFGGEGEIVDYALKMKRIPEEMMMINLLKEGRVDEPMVERVARAIVAFHRDAKTGPAIEAFGSPETIRKNVDENFTQTKRYIGKTISGSAYDTLKEYSERFIEEKTPLFEGRMRGGKIRDCHGDIHMEHVCIADKVYIYDCIEFNDRFRYGDVASDIAFLAMDLDFHGEQGLSNSLVKSYIDEAGDGEIMKLIDFYKCYRACVRGKVDSFELDDPGLSPEEKEEAGKIAGRYFDLALSYAVD